MDITGRELPQGGVVGETQRVGGSILRQGWACVEWHCVIAANESWSAWCNPCGHPFAHGACTDPEDGDRQACAAIAAAMGWEE
jgi:hypothetical protein